MSTRAHINEQFRNPLAAAAMLAERGHDFSKAANFTLIGSGGACDVIRYSAEQLQEARAALQSMSQVSGGQTVAGNAAPTAPDVRAPETSRLV